MKKPTIRTILKDWTKNYSKEYVYRTFYSENVFVIEKIPKCMTFSYKYQADKKGKVKLKKK